MSAGWVHDLVGVGVDDQAPIAYAVTDDGWRHRPGLLTPAEGALLAGVSCDVVQAAARSGSLVGVKVSRCWLIERDALDDWVEARAAAARLVPAAPLLEAVAARGGRAACGVRPSSADERALDRAARDGHLTERMADRLAVRLLGLTLWEVTG